MAAHSSVLAWKIPWTEEPSGQESDTPECLYSVTSLSDFTFTFSVSFCCGPLFPPKLSPCDPLQTPFYSCFSPTEKLDFLLPSVWSLNYDIWPLLTCLFQLYLLFFARLNHRLRLECSIVIPWVLVVYLHFLHSQPCSSFLSLKS